MNKWLLEGKVWRREMGERVVCGGFDGVVKGVRVKSWSAGLFIPGGVD